MKNTLVHAKLLCCSLLIVVFGCSIQAQQITWQNYYGAVTIVNAGHSIIEMPDSGFVVAAKVFANYPNSITLIRLDKFGDTLWTRAYSGSKPEKIIHTKDSGIVIVGAMYGPSILIIRLNSLFDTLWTKTYPSFNMSHGYDICETHDNGFVVATQGSFFKVDKSGNFQWDVYMGYCAAVKQGFNGDIIASGSTCNNPDIYTVDRVDSMGAVIWNRTYGNISNTSDWWAVSDFVFLLDSNIIAVCQYQTGGWHLMKINYATGDTMLTGFLPVPGINRYNSIVYTSDSNLVISMDDNLCKTDTAGQLIWSKPIGWRMNEITGCSDGGIALAGLMYPSPPQSVVTYAKTDSLGDIYNFQGIEHLYGNSETWIYPNPVTTTATLQFENAQQQQVTLTVYDVLGNEVMRKETTGSSIIINAAALKSGMYFYTLNVGSELYNGKFVVR